jgi:hypothetical protein
MKKLNTTAVCIPSRHYMVDLSKRVAEIKKMVGAGEYFTIKQADDNTLFQSITGKLMNYIEAQTRDQKRTDVIIDYLGQQYIIELKIWHGERYNAEGEKQISEYLEYFGLSTGYMLSFNFNKKKETGVHPVMIGDKMIYEGTV